MHLPVCSVCKQKWTWKETWKSSLRLDTRIPCPKCQSTQFIHPKVFPDCMHTSVSNLVQHGKFH